MKTVTLKNIILSIIIFLLFNPLLQENFSIFTIKPLEGAFTPLQKPDSLIENWFSGKFQEKYEPYFNENIGFRPFFIRLNNQIKYSFYDIIKTKLTVLGENNHLFQSDYIDAYMGFDFVGNERIKKGFERIQYIQNELNKRGIYFVLVFAPGKASFMPENIPSQYNIEKRTQTNYDSYVSYFKNSKINFIDFNKYFIEIKNKKKHPLYPVNGTHWSGYGCTIATDSLTNYLSKLMNIKMVKQKDLGGIITNTEMKWSDDDLAKPINLFQNIDNLDMYYPNISYISDSNTVKPKALFVGDSYVQSLYRFYPYLDNVFDLNSSFWSYNYVVKWNNRKIIEDEVFVRDLNVEEEVLNKDVVVMLITEMNIKILDELFTERFSNLFQEIAKRKPHDTNISFSSSAQKSNNTDIQSQIEKIKKNKEWFEGVKKQAKERKLTEDQMLYNTAVYWIKSQKK